MADKNDGGDKTEKPTPKKLQDARRKGQVPKSRDLSSTVPLAAWLAVFALGTVHAGRELAALAEAAVGAIAQPFDVAAPALGERAWRTALWLSVAALLPTAAVGLVTEYLQAGPVFSAERLKPKAEHLNPVEGVKRMFGLDNLVELAKSLAKCLLLLLIGWLVLRAALPQVTRLLDAPAGVRSFGALLLTVTEQALTWTLVGFALVAALDVAWQRHSFTKKMRMSVRDIKQEAKESEGDPHVRQQRRQAHQEWSQRNAQQAARQANVLVVNPTHVAIAIDYDRERCPVPVVSAKGEDHVARAMREAAEEAGVPIVRNVPLARDLLSRGEVGEIVPAELFDVVAEVVLWAREVRRAMEQGEPPRRAAPGEDLSAYRGTGVGRPD